MSRSLLLSVIIAGVGAGAYYYLTQPEPTPAEKLQSAAEEAKEAVSDAVESISEQADQTGQAASELAEKVEQAASDLAEQAGQTASDLADHASEQVAALTTQGQALLQQWVEDGTLSVQNFDYDALVASVQESDLSETLKTRAVEILDQIKESPQVIAEKIQELQTLLSEN